MGTEQNEGTPGSVQVTVGNDTEQQTESETKKGFLDKVKDARDKAGKAILMIDFVVVLHIVMIIIGSIYVKDCPAERYIPIYLIVMGVFGTIRNLLDFFEFYRSEKGQKPITKFHNKIINLFIFCWFIAGCVWVYRAYKPNFYSPESPLYCNKVVYLFTFWLINLTFILIAIVFLVCCCFIWFIAKKTTE
ncbi:uncharacterized protein LOC111637250 [Centruroides sculpturatus]|uniref:uncharacterized protein LOC111637250 n=1 Tax=Centruroides sculpturatus TaxID=218467 RepID=UPI000C6D9F66|nr:uncharacterized protein LOC111637250 [Centruroides sculpturatus]